MNVLQMRRRELKSTCSSAHVHVHTHTCMGRYSAITCMYTLPHKHCIYIVHVQLLYIVQKECFRHIHVYIYMTCTSDVMTFVYVVVIT